MKKLCRFCLLAVLLLGLVVPSLAAGPDKEGPIVILHTNDVHASLDHYPAVAGYKKRFEAEYGADRVFLVDAGDAIQGGPIATLTQGASVVDMMNFVGYDLAIPGNHEFDYGMDVFLDLAQNQAEYLYLSENWKGRDAYAGWTTVLPGAYMARCGDTSIAFVGVTTPETLTKSDPTHFQDGEGNYVYTFSEGDGGLALYEDIQQTVDSLRTAGGADYVILLAHLGIEGITEEWTSAALIASTTGIDAVIDGHSHEVYQQQAANRDGQLIPLTQTGTKLASLGCLILDPDTGEISTQLLPLEGEGVPADQETQIYLDQLSSQFQVQLNRVVGTAAADLMATEADQWNWAVRVRETNLGDLVADAYRTMMGADIGFANGGGIRANVAAGDITYGSLISVQPYGNELCLVETTGQDILDALELGASRYPESSGGFLQVSGLTYTLDPSTPSSVVLSDKGMFQRVEGSYRVSDVKVGGQPLVLDQVYTVASHNYMIKSGGDGFFMFQDDRLLKDCTMLDNQALISYVAEELDGLVGAAYQDPAGQDRITILSDVSEPEPVTGTQPQDRTYTVQKGDCLWSIAARQLGDGRRWQEIYDRNRDILSNPHRIYVGQQLRLP